MSNAIVFKKKQLFDQLGFDFDDVKLIMKYQKTMPILQMEENSIVNARLLHEQLGVGRDFSTWIKGRISKFGFVEGVDFTISDTIHQNGGLVNGGYKSIKEYTLTIDMAKELAMIENNEIGRMVRKYFIKCEKALKQLVEWERVRTPEKGLYKEMCSELNSYMLRNENKKAETHHYINEANMLNKICLGANAKDIREFINAQDNNTRDYLNVKYNTYLYKMEELDIMYLKMNMSKEVRCNLIQQGFKAMYPNASFFMCDIDIKRTIENKMQYPLKD